MPRAFWLCILLILPNVAHAAPQNVWDYFRLLPQSSFFETSNREKWFNDARKHSAGIPADNKAILDLKNDYLQFPGDGAQPRLELGLFRYHSQKTLGVCTDSEEEELTFWRYSNGKLRDVTRRVFPFSARFKTPVSYKIPRVGTTIQVFKGGWPDKASTKVWKRFVWRRGRFVEA